MPILCCNIAALAVTALYYVWRAYDKARTAKARVLRERVAYMLWVVADRMDSQNRPVSVN
jgi:hypothetical protein